jgi:hypothetical protein
VKKFTRAAAPARAARNRTASRRIKSSIFKGF